MDFVSNVGSIDWSTPSWDLFIILFFIVSAFIYGFSLGRDRIVTILMSIYMSLALVTYAPFLGLYTASLHIGDLFVIRITLFIGVFLFLFFVLSRSAIASFIGRHESDGSWFQILIFSFLHIGLLIAVVLSFLPDTITSSLAPLTQRLFLDPYAVFGWVAAPIVAMVLLRGRVKAEDED